jgi:hypothetical protein
MRTYQVCSLFQAYLWLPVRICKHVHERIKHGLIAADGSFQMMNNRFSASRVHR